MWTRQRIQLESKSLLVSLAALLKCKEPRVRLLYDRMPWLPPPSSTQARIETLQIHSDDPGHAVSGLVCRLFCMDHKESQFCSPCKWGAGCSAALKGLIVRGRWSFTAELLMAAIKNPTLSLAIRQPLNKCIFIHTHKCVHTHIHICVVFLIKSHSFVSAFSHILWPHSFYLLDTLLDISQMSGLNQGLIGELLYWSHGFILRTMKEPLMLQKLVLLVTQSFVVCSSVSRCSSSWRWRSHDSVYMAVH